MTIKNIGVICRTATPQGPYLSNYGAGNIYGHAAFTYSGYTKQSCLIVLNLDLGTAVQGRGPIGTIYASCRHHPDFKLWFVCSWAGSSNAGQVFSFNPDTGESIKLFDCPDVGATKQGLYYGSGPWSDEPHKRLLFTGTQGGLLVWDHVTSTLQNYGQLHADIGSLNSVQASTTHAYCGGTAPSDSRFVVIVDLATGDKTNWGIGAGYEYLYVCRGVDEKIYIWTKIDDVSTFWEIDPEDPLVPVNIGSGDPGIYGAGTRWTSNYAGHSASGLNLYPDVNDMVRFNYVEPVGGAQSLDVTLLYVDDYPIQRMGIDAEHNIVCCPQNYGETRKYIPATDEKVSVGGFGSISPYAFGIDRHRNLQWFSGYPDETWQHDPTDPTWDLVTNPVKLTGMPHYGGKGRASFVARGNDGIIWFGTSLENPPEGCQIFWYDPDTSTYGEIDRSVMAAGAPDYYHYPKFCMNLSATKLVMSALHADGSTKGLVAVVYMPWKTVKYLYPLGDVVDQGVLVSVERSKTATNHFVGITNSVGGTYKAYCLNIQTGAFVWGPITGISGVTSFPYLNGGQPIFRHRYVWFYVGDTIVKRDPDDGALIGSPYDLVANGTVAGNMLWSDDGEYLYHFGINVPDLFQIPKADLGV